MKKNGVFSDLLNRVPLSIRAKITVPYIILATLLAFGAALIVTRIVFDTIEERFTNQLIEAGKLASERMVEEENQLLSSLRQLAFSEGVPAAIIENDPIKLRKPIGSRRVSRSFRKSCPFDVPQEWRPGRRI